MGKEAEVVVIGGGTTGCVVAGRLAERGRSVLLLEAGGRYRPSLLGAPLPSQRLRSLFAWNYTTAPQPELEGRRIGLPLGRVLGGSSSINAMMYCPGRPSDYRRWEDLGNPGWSSATVAACYDRAVAEDGDGAPFAVSRPRFRSAFSEAVVRAGDELGYDLDFYHVSQRAGSRTSTAPAYLPSGLATGRLEVVTRASVVRILFDGRRAVGVEYRQRRRLRRVMAGEIVLSAGAVNSPRLLLLSGIGHAPRLGEHGIPVVADLPGVGANLMDHVRVPVLFQLESPGPGDARYWGPALLQYLLFRRGVFTSNCCEAGGFVRSDPDLAEPDLQFVTHFKHPFGPRVVDLEVCLMRPRSRGQVRLRSASPDDPPIIQPGYLSEPADRQRLVRGIWMARDLARTRALSQLPLGNEVLPGSAIQRTEDLVRYLRRSVETCYHLAGTCRMGADQDSVVDEQLRVRGVEGLRVADTSIMPDLIRGNTLAPALAIGERAADLLAPTTRSTRGPSGPAGASVPPPAWGRSTRTPTRAASQARSSPL